MTESGQYKRPRDPLPRGAHRSNSHQGLENRTDAWQLKHPPATLPPVPLVEALLMAIGLLMSQVMGSVHGLPLLDIASVREEIVKVPGQHNKAPESCQA